MVEILDDVAFLNRFRKTTDGNWVLVGIGAVNVAGDDVRGWAGWFPGQVVTPSSVAFDDNVYERLERLAAIHGMPVSPHI